MEVVLFGYGFMGSLLHRFLKANKNISKIYVVDPCPRNKLPEGEKIYSSFDELPENHKVQAGFVASNSVTHFSVLKTLFEKGIKNIFCEKPMCLSQKEYKDIFKIMPKDSRVVVDYILRASNAFIPFREQVEDLKNRGFKLRQANVIYGKDKSSDPRRFRDIGVYEELYHVWDLCFNDVLVQDVKSIKTVKNIYYPDPEIEKRCLAQRFKYLMETNSGDKSFLNIYTNFKLPMRHRGFALFFYKGAQKETLSLVFDQNGCDRCIHVNNKGKEEVFEYPSNTKLETKIKDCVHYFRTDQKAPYFHDAMTSFKSHVVLEKMGQTAAMNKSALMERILLSKTEKQNA